MAESFFLYVCEFSNNKRYFGITNNPERRFKRYRHDCKTSHYHFHRALKKYPEAKFILIGQFATRELANQVEIAFIKHHRKLNPSMIYNISDGGDGGAAHRGKTHTAETKALISAKKKGCIGPNRGRVFSEEVRAKQSLAKKGKPSPKRKELYCVETGEVFSCAEEAGKSLGIGRTNIHNMLCGWSRSAGGLTFKYMTEIGGAA